MPEDAAGCTPRTVVVGLIADPGPPQQIAQKLADLLPRYFSEAVTDEVEWSICVSHEPLALDPDQGLSLTSVARERMPVQGWDLIVCLTDLPRSMNGSPVVADVSTTHGAAVTSLPAIGWFRRDAQAQATVLRAVRVMARETLGLQCHDEPHRRAPHRTISHASLVQQVNSTEYDVDVHLVLRGYRGRVRLLYGMVRDNQPWRLVPSLSRALAAACATAAFGVFFSNIWSMAHALTVGRLGLINVFAITAMVAWLIIHNSLWENASAYFTRRRAVFYNVSTTATLLVGVLCMYILLFALTFAAALVVISAEYLSQQLGSPAGPADYLKLAWLASSMGTVAGALGSSLETEGAVRRATYSKRERERRELLKQRQREQEESTAD